MNSKPLITLKRMLALLLVLAMGAVLPAMGEGIAIDLESNDEAAVPEVDGLEIEALPELSDVDLELSNDLDLELSNDLDLELESVEPNTDVENTSKPIPTYQSLDYTLTLGINNEINMNLQDSLTINSGMGNIVRWVVNGLNKDNVIKIMRARDSLNSLIVKPIGVGSVIIRIALETGTMCTVALRIRDALALKDMGFTMVRKHIKIEPLRWYYYCDKMGILVWQDMVNGGGKYNPLMIAVLPFLNIMFKDNTKTAYQLFSRGDAAGRAEFERETMETVDYLKNVVSLAMWVPFNEGWGQFDSDRISELIEKKDPTRTVDRTSGWHDQHTGDFVSKHIYFTPIWVPKDERCYLLSEFGGFSRPIQGHMLSDAIPFGYRMYFTKWRLQRAYRKTYEKRIIANIPRGLSACVFTQLSDVEGEINGLITYDRRVDKMDRNFVKSVNDRVKY